MSSRFISPILGVNTSSPLPQHVIRKLEQEQAVEQQKQEIQISAADCSKEEHESVTVVISRARDTAKENNMNTDVIRSACDHLDHSNVMDQCNIDLDQQTVAVNNELKEEVNIDTLHSYIKHLEGKNSALCDRVCKIESECEAGRRCDEVREVMSRSQDALQQMMEGVRELRHDILTVLQVVQGFAMNFDECGNNHTLHTSTLPAAYSIMKCPHTTSSDCAQQTTGSRKTPPTGGLLQSDTSINCCVCMETTITKEMQDLKAKVGLFEDQGAMISAITDQMNGLRRERQDIEDDLQEMKSRYQELIVQYLVDKQRIRSLELEVVDRQREVDELHQGLSDMKRSNERLVQSLCERDADVDQLRKGLAAKDEVAEDRGRIVRELQGKLLWDNQMYRSLSYKCYHLIRFIKLLSDTISQRLVQVYVDHASEPTRHQASKGNKLVTSLPSHSLSNIGAASASAPAGATLISVHNHVPVNDSAPADAPVSSHVSANSAVSTNNPLTVAPSHKTLLVDSTVKDVHTPSSFVDQNMLTENRTVIECNGIPKQPHQHTSKELYRHDLRDTLNWPEHIHKLLTVKDVSDDLASRLLESFISHIDHLIIHSAATI